MFSLTQFKLLEKKNISLEIIRYLVMEVNCLLVHFDDP